jgi:hypothetical protein
VVVLATCLGSVNGTREKSSVSRIPSFLAASYSEARPILPVRQAPCLPASPHALHPFRKRCHPQLSPTPWRRRPALLPTPRPQGNAEDPRAIPRVFGKRGSQGRLGHRGSASAVVVKIEQVHEVAHRRTIGWNIRIVCGWYRVR